MSLRGMFVLVALWLVGCRQEVKVAFDTTPPPPIETNFDRLPTVLAGIPKTGAALLYEGLPSEFWEPEALVQELARAKTIKLHGYPLYEELLAWQGTDGEQLTALFSARTSFAKYTDGKKGGGFHANYCLEWKSGEGTTHVVIALEGGAVVYTQLDPSCGPKASQAVAKSVILRRPIQRGWGRGGVSVARLL